MHRRISDEVERQISDWERIRWALGPNAVPDALTFVDDELVKLRHRREACDRPRVWGRRATDPRPTLLNLHP